MFRAIKKKKQIITSLLKIEETWLMTPETRKITQYIICLHEDSE